MSLRRMLNFSDEQITFINTETSRDSRVLQPDEQSGDIGAWWPWCTREADFPAHHFEIIDTSTNETLWYAWQQNNQDGDWIRITRTPFGQDDQQRFRTNRDYNLVLLPGGAFKMAAFR